MAHTPGPWVVVNGTDVFSALGAPRNDGIKADQNDGWQVADCGVGVTFVEGLSRTLKPSEQRANAHLIAAAPDLLEALKGLLSRAVLGAMDTEDVLRDYGNLGMSHIRAAQAAIAKAEGKR